MKIMIDFQRSLSCSEVELIYLSMSRDGYIRLQSNWSRMRANLVWHSSSGVRNNSAVGGQPGNEFECKDSSVMRFLRIDPMIRGSTPPSAKLSLRVRSVAKQA